MAIGIYLLIAALVYGINLVPAFMPPTWIFLAFFYIHFKTSFIITVLIGAAMATLGRVSLALLSKKYVRPKISEESLGNYDALGKFLKKHEKLSIPIFILYAFFPFSSNYVYIMAGLTEINLKILAITFFFGRIVSYSFWVAATYKLSEKLEDIFANRFSDFNFLLFQILGFLVILLIGKIKWKKILRKKK